ITLVTGAGACGGQGVLTADNIQSSHNPDNSSKFFDTFGSDITTGNNGGCINKNSGSYTMQMRGLSAGIYTLTMLVGRGNSFGTASSTYDLTGNIEGLSATLLDYSASSNASLSGTTLFSESGAGEWALVEYTFTVTKDNTTLSLTSNGTGNINALALSSIPEPATASLGLLGLAVLAMRRRRA
ncbi:PEP-CTERM sorting domain-containing protein, partial [Akkermansia sp.]|uniref:PEP-CTERM sorting domain-containing protein n=1 Tax=Akkermansia sp. TaxID=1872421 RepID=UPI003AADA0C6